MSKIKQMMVYGLVATSFGLGGCSTYTTNGKPIDFANEEVIKIDPNDPIEVRLKQKENTGRGLIGLLENEYDRVRYFIHEHNGETDLVIRGSNDRGNNSWPDCQFNVDSVCKDYVKRIPVFRYILGQEVHLISDEANLIKCKMSRSTAEELDSFMSKYAQLNNGKRCEPFVKTMKMYFTAWGK